MFSRESQIFFVISITKMSIFKFLGKYFFLVVIDHQNSLCKNRQIDFTSVRSCSVRGCHRYTAIYCTVCSGVGVLRIGGL